MLSGGQPGPPPGVDLRPTNPLPQGLRRPGSQLAGDSLKSRRTPTVNQPWTQQPSGPRAAALDRIRGGTCHEEHPSMNGVSRHPGTVQTTPTSWRAGWAPQSPVGVTRIWRADRPEASRVRCTSVSSERPAAATGLCVVVGFRLDQRMRPKRCISRRLLLSSDRSTVIRSLSRSSGPIVHSESARTLPGPSRRR